MKKIVILVLIFTSLNTFSQIKQVENIKAENIGVVKDFSAKWIECTKKGNVYTFIYQDTKYTHITEYKSFSFKDVNNDFKKLYNIIIKGLKDMPKDDIKLELENDIVWLHFDKSFGSRYVEFRHSPMKNSNILGVSTWLTKKRIKKLFGIKKK